MICLLTVDDQNDITIIQNVEDELEDESGNPFSVLKVDPNEVTFIEHGVDVEVDLEQNDGKSLTLLRSRCR